MIVALHFRVLMTRTKDLIRYKKTGFGKGRRTVAAQGLDYIIEVAEFSNDPLGLMNEAPEVHKELIVEAPNPLN